MADRNSFQVLYKDATFIEEIEQHLGKGDVEMAKQMLSDWRNELTEIIGE